MQRAPNECGLALAAPQPKMSSHVPRARAMVPGPPQSIDVREDDGGSDTDLSFRLTFLSDKPGTQWTGQRGQPNTQDPRARR